MLLKVSLKFILEYLYVDRQANIHKEHQNRISALCMHMLTRSPLDYNSPV